MEIKWVNEIGDSLFWMLVDGGWWWLMINTMFQAPNWYLKLLMQPLLEHLPYHLDAMEWKWLNLDNQISQHSLGHWMPFHDIPTVLWHLIHNHLLYSLNMAWWFTQSLIPPKKLHVILNIQRLGYLKHPHKNFNQHWSPRDISTGGTGWGSSLHVHSKTSSTWHGGAWWCDGATVKICMG
jgi:hypothetical protein